MGYSKRSAYVRGGRNVRRRMVPALAAVVLAASVGACSAGGSEAKSASFDGVGPINLVIGKDPTGTNQKIVDIWNRQHPDQKVTQVYLPGQADEQRQQMVQNAQTRSAAHSVIYIDAVWTAEFAAHGWIMPLPADQFPTKKYVPAALETAKYFGKMYAVPFDSGASMLYYRKDLLAKAGIAAPPTTWTEMKTACAKVSALPEGKGISCYGGQFNKYEGLTCNFAEAVASAGGSLVDASGKPTVNTPEAKKGLDFLIDGFASGMIPKAAITWDEDGSRRPFQQGQVLFMRNWGYVWNLGNATDGSSAIAGKFAAAPLPGLTGPGKSTLGENNLAISSYAKNKKTALDFVKWFSNEQNALAFTKGNNGGGAYQSMYSRPEILKQLPYLPAQKKALETAVARPNIVRYQDASAAIQISVTEALTGKKTSAQALAELQTNLTKIVAQK